MSILITKGTTQEGTGDFIRRMTEYPSVFQKAVGHKLYPGTLNINVGAPIFIKEHFRILGRDIEEPEDFLFEICKANGVWAYRIRPYHPNTAQGGYGDHVLEIASEEKIPGVEGYGSIVEVSFFR